MPGITWLGQQPDRGPSRQQQNVSAVAEALGKGTQAYFGTREKAQQYGLQKEELGIKKKAVEVEMAKVDYTQRKNLVDDIKELRDRLDDEQWQTMLNNPSTIDLIVSVSGEIGLNNMRAMQRKVDERASALKAIGEGKTLPGLTMEETKRVAGAMVSPIEALQSQLGDILSEKGGAGFTVKPPVRPTTPAVPPIVQRVIPPNSELVTVTNLSGERVRIKKSQLQDAFKQGFRQ